MKRTNKRQGFSLLELMVAISVAGVMLFVTVGWIHQTMKTASAVKQLHQHHQNLTRLSGSLRDHVRDCKTIAMDGDNRLSLTWDNGTQAVYEIVENELRFEKTGPGSSGGEPITLREAFALSPKSTAQWETNEMPARIGLIVSRRGIVGHTADSPDSELEMPVDLHVQVAPDRWSRSIGVAGSGETEIEESK